MPQINKIYHKFENEIMTVQQYKEYILAHPDRSNIKAIECVECGDLITYYPGEHNVSHFRHSKSHEGHNYCSLYKQGTESKAKESEIRRKLVSEQDISFNFELLFNQRIWKSIITLPPFTKQEIDNYEKNNTNIHIGTHDFPRDIKIISLDNNHFKEGEIKKIYLNGCPSRITIQITGNSSIKNIYYYMDGFEAENQIYSSLILQNIDHPNNCPTIDFRKIKSFVCKRNGRRVYIGKHYIIFSYADNILKLCENRKDITVTPIIIEGQIKQDCNPYDVVFNEVNDFTKRFCSDRKCLLSEKNDAMILWPPICSIGNYKYYKNEKTYMFISIQNDARNIELCKLKIINKPYFKISNPNSNSFYVSHYKDDIQDKQKDNFFIERIDKEDSFDKNEQIYLFNKDVVIGKYDVKSKLKKKHTLMQLDNQLCKKMFSLSYPNSKNKNDELLGSIRYSRSYITFRKQDYEYLITKFIDNKEIIEYLEHCHSVGTIKKEAIHMMMEGE